MLGCGVLLGQWNCLDTEISVDFEAFGGGDEEQLRCRRLRRALPTLGCMVATMRARRCAIARRRVVSIVDKIMT